MLSWQPVSQLRPFFHAGNFEDEIRMASGVTLGFAPVSNGHDELF